MTVNNQNDEGRGAGSAAAPSPRGRRRRQPVGGVLGWSRKRVVSAIAVTAASAAFLLAATGMAAVPTSGWTGYVFVAAGSILAGLLAGSYVGAPIGAAATFCDLRWPVAGLLGLVWANTYRGDQPPVQIAVGVLALAVMAWALRARLELERQVSLAPDPENAEAEVCTDCRPLFPAKPQQPS